MTTHHQGATGTRLDAERGRPRARSASPRREGAGGSVTAAARAARQERAPLVLERVYQAHDGVPEPYDHDAEGDFRDPWTRTDWLLVLVLGAIVALGIFAGFGGWGVG